jgi:hypothetical protein
MFLRSFSSFLALTSRKDDFMTSCLRFSLAVSVIAAALQAHAAAQYGGIPVPPAPQNLQVPSGHVAYLKGSATGTQNYVCAPGQNGPAWKFLGPEATLFLTFPWINGEGRQQIATHFLSVNPADGKSGPTWQHSIDTSAVWARAIANSTDPNYVAPGAIPWLLLEITGTQRGPMGGSALVRTTYIQRLKTSGGTAPGTGCDEAGYGTFLLVPYTTDYYFYKAAN